MVAGRLTEHPARSVALIEAGPALVHADLDGPLGGPDFLAALDVPGRTFPSLVSRFIASVQPPESTLISQYTRYAAPPDGEIQ